ncbi:copper resistance protein B [uncultured Brevundimonas sp.]|uniref:copper resistance protein B n=1 Tax=uncultured Brevundimonas sp. TaxID=213418 RepID=UPI0030EC43D3|tara:strand:- start:9809 stop:11383 length:1575 start_codon:yes stop_codon:yes gene_type:complete
MIRTSVALLPLMLVAAPAFAQSHAGHTPAAQVQPAPLPPGCVRRGAPDADAPRIGTPGAPVCPTGAVPARLRTSAPDPHAGHDMSGMAMSPTPATAPADPHAGHDMTPVGQTSPAPAMPADHDMSGMAMSPTPATVLADPHAGHDMTTMGQTSPAPAVPAGHDMSTMGISQTPADPHAGHDMPGMAMGQTPTMPADHDMSGMVMSQAPATVPADPHAGHDMTTMGQTSSAPAMPAGHDMSMMGTSQTPADPHAGHDMSGMAMPPDIQTSANNPGRPPEMPPPAAASSGPTHAADLLFDPAEMAAAREQLRVENGEIRTTAVIIDRLEANFADGEQGYTWDAQGWTGDDINRFWWKTEGEGEFGGGVEDAEVQALYSRAFRPFWDVQTGLRQTYRPEGDRTDLVVGVQGLAPYWFEVDVAAFLSNKGELTARAEVEYDQRITNRWILQPRAEINFSAEDIPELSIGSGLTSLQFGARLRYEIRKEFAPYVGLEWNKSFGNTADFLEADGRSSEDTRLVVGIRAWF